MYGGDFIQGPDPLNPNNNKFLREAPISDDLKEAIVFGNDAIMWFGVGGAGVLYILLGTLELFGGWKENLWFCKFWGYAKVT